MEMAKAHKDAREEVLRSADFVRHVAEEGRRSAGDAQFSDVFPRDADIGAAASHIVAGAFAYAGQRCTAVKRVLVVDSVADSLVDALAARIAKLSVGDPRHDATVTPRYSIEAMTRLKSVVFNMRPVDLAGVG